MNDEQIRCLMVPVLLLLFLPLFAFAQAAPVTIEKVASQLRLHHPSVALELLEPAVRQSPNDPRLWTMRGVALSNLRRNREALAAYNHALTIAPAYLPALEGAAQIKYEAGDKDVIALLQHILTLRPDDPTTHAMLAALAYKRGDCPEAVRHFDRSDVALSSEPVALNQYGSCLAALHRLDEGKKVFQRILNLDFNDAHARSRLATIQLMEEHPEEAIATLRPLLEGHPDTQVFELAAAAFESARDTPQAERTLRKAMAMDPASIDLYIDFAGLAFDHQSFESAIEMMTSGLRGHPEAPALYLERGILYVQIADYEKAEADFAKADQLDPHQSLGGVARSKISEQNGDFDKGLAAVRKELAKNPKDAFLLYTQADILAQRGVEPGTKDFRLALESARKAGELQPGLILACDILGGLYLQAGQYELSIQQSRRALESDPKDQAALYHLILALRKSGEARELPVLLQQLARLREEARKESFRNRQISEPLE